MAPELSIIICTYNRDPYIDQSILHILNQAVSKDKYELIVVNNNSTDRTDEICRELLTEHDFRYFIETSQGLSYARNRGISESRGEILAFIDDDAMAAPDFIQNLLNFYHSRPNVSASGGRIYPRYETAKPHWISKFLMPLMSVIDLGDQPKAFTLGSYPIGANMAFRRSVIESVGDFNTSLGRSGKNLQGGEEKDIFQRIRSKGLDVWYIPDVIVDHVIPEARLQPAFIRKMGNGIGESERIRTSEISSSMLRKAYFRELAKWVATLGLSLGYFLSFQPAKAMMLVKFRYWVSSGLFKQN